MGASHSSRPILTLTGCVEQRSLLTLPEIRTELWKSLFSGKARETILNSGAKIGAF